jgi:hypothetical protein
MIGALQIQEILAQYKRHGWTLRRVLLCPATRENLTDSLENLFGDAPVILSETDAVWFSRPSGIGREAWELRRLSNPPFALVEVFEDEDDEAVREETLHEMQEQLINGKRKM